MAEIMNGRIAAAKTPEEKAKLEKYSRMMEQVKEQIQNLSK